MDYRRPAGKLLQQGGQAERKLLRTLVAEVELMPQDLEVRISYRLPEAIIQLVSPTLYLLSSLASC